MCPNLQETEFAHINEEIFNGKHHFWYSMNKQT